MTATKQKSVPVEGLVINMVKPRRITREDYMRIQACRRLAKLEKSKTVEFTNPEGLQDMRITYTLNGKELTAPTLTAFGHVIAEKLASLIEQWTPDKGVVQLTEMLSSMNFCDPKIEVDITKLKSGRIPEKLKGIIQIADNQGFGLNRRGEIVHIDELLSSITQAEKLGMVFTR